MSLNQRLIRTNDTGGGGTSTQWIVGDNVGNLFYTQDATGLTGWTDSGQNLGGIIGDAVFTGSVWIAAVSSNGIWQTSDITATSGWSKVAGGTNTFFSVSWTPSGVVVSGVSNNILYTTDATGATGWTQFPGLSGTSDYQGVANDGSKSFFSLWNTATEYAYSNSLFGGGVNYLVSDFDSDDSRGVFYDPINSYYFIVGKGVNIKYRTTIGGSYTNVNATGFAANGYNNMDFNGTYYVTGGGTRICYSTNSTSGWSNYDVSSIGIGNVTDLSSNDTTFACGNVSGNMLFATNPAGPWTKVPLPSGFGGSITYKIIPSKKPYYNAITNLGY